MDHMKLLRPDWPPEPDAELSHLSGYLDRGDFQAVLESSFARSLLGLDEPPRPTKSTHLEDVSIGGIFDSVSKRLGQLLHAVPGEPEGDTQLRHSSTISTFLVGHAALDAFLQANVTGPPLLFSSDGLLFPSQDVTSARSTSEDHRRAELIRSLVVDGIGPYSLIPHVELFCLARLIFNHPGLRQLTGVKRVRLRTNFIHQRLLTEQSPTLQDSIYKDLEGTLPDPDTPTEDQIEYWLERASINIYYGRDDQARDDLTQAARLSGFQFTLTGRLGKRTKFQQKDTSQLVVLAQSKEESLGGALESEATENLNGKAGNGPQNLKLDDDTLLESISFRKDANNSPADQDELPPALAALDPSSQPLLKPLDSLILLAYASSISNTRPSHGLTREETLPYATRVLDGGSSNWQIYTQALLVRSRIEGYSSRTQERGLLQLQALVDQIIAETAAGNSKQGEEISNTIFLPRPAPNDAAPVTERLRYIHQLNSPARWELEAELAARWISVGGLKSALEIYERLQMWAEIALCYAALEQSERARSILRRQLFESNVEDINEDNSETPETWSGPERSLLPADAPRLFCILGDIEQEPSWYERAWEVSRQRYPRAQSALGRYFFARREYTKAVDAYTKSLVANRLDHSGWFALGSAKLQLSDWDGAVEAYLRAVQLNDEDGESWSNLAAALLKRGPHRAQLGPATIASGSLDHDDNDDEDADEDGVQEKHPPSEDPQRYKQDALKAFLRAARLKYDDWRIWENVLTTAASIQPPSSMDIIRAMTRLVELRGPTLGERSIDVDILDRLVRHIISTNDDSTQNQGLSSITRMTIEMLEKFILPQITTSPRLWQIVARVYLWQKKPGSALDASEKAWRALVGSSTWETGSEEQWNHVVSGTLELVDAYENLGPSDRTEGLGAGEGVPVAKDWRFKARNALRGVMGRGRAGWEDTEGWEKLKGRMEEIKLGG
ncbi:MAG: Malate dehydrogenase, cytoplasmic [Watsoniomyces obsoletus]|nr:MAG: Malate dehydrogenase, cytoplasmic [Watsoniomyces obsoletus]